MTPFESVLREMPDIANDAKPEVAGKLAWVGMNEIEMPVRIEDDAGGRLNGVTVKWGHPLAVSGQLAQSNPDASHHFVLLAVI